MNIGWRSSDRPLFDWGAGDEERQGDDGDTLARFALSYLFEGDSNVGLWAAAALLIGYLGS